MHRKHNEIVLSILRENKARHLVKSKSMLTEECHLNPFLIKNGVEVIDTDFGRADYSTDRRAAKSHRDARHSPQKRRCR